MERQLDWLLIEGRLRPIFDASLRAYKRKAPIGLFDDDDVLQEGRLALFRALKRYNSERGSLERFASVILQRTYNTMLRKQTCKSRMPRKSVLIDSEWVLVAYFPEKLEKSLGFKSKALTPLEELQEKEKKRLVERLKNRVYEELSDTGKKVFECFESPPHELLNIVRADCGDPTKIKRTHIGQFLGLEQHSVQWYKSKIKKILANLAKEEEFEDLIYA